MEICNITRCCESFFLFGVHSIKSLGGCTRVAVSMLGKTECHLDESEDLPVVWMFNQCLRDYGRIIYG